MGIFDSLQGGWELPPELKSYIQSLQRQTQGRAPLAQNQQGFRTAGNYLQQLFGQGDEAMDAFQQPAMNQFQQEIIPQIAERFSLGNEKGSSAFQNSLAQAGGNLAAMLNQQRGQMQQQALPQLLNMSQIPFNQYSQLGSQLMGAPYTYKPGIGIQWFSSLGNVGAKAAASYFGF